MIKAIYRRTSVERQLINCHLFFEKIQYTQTNIDHILLARQKVWGSRLRMYVILGPGKSTRPLRVQMKYVSNTQPKLATLLFFFARTCKKRRTMIL
jgi:hypothetical protein